MTPQKASQIVGRVASHMENQTYAGSFTPLSVTGAPTFRDVSHAFYIDLANEYQREAPDFDGLVELMQGAFSHICFMFPCLPDYELERIKTLSIRKNPIEFINEEKRLRALADDSGIKSMETMTSYAKFLKALNPQDESFWVKAYSRFGSECPKELKPKQPQMAILIDEPWWKLW